jgi:hypothetical protein
MGVNWSKDIDQILAAAKDQFHPILLLCGWKAICPMAISTLL